MDFHIPRLPTISNINVTNKKIFMRIDINVPVNPTTGEITDDRRIRNHAKYIKEIIEEYNPALVLGSHQGRPGDPGFTTMEKHAELLSKYIGKNVKYIEDVIGPSARKEIRELKTSEILLLENLRLISEEVNEAPIEKQSNTIMCKVFSSLFDVYINDAFATAHRSQPSIVGLPLVLPSAIGPVFEQEIEAIKRIVENKDSSKVFVLGGSKIVEHLRIIENLTKNKLADRVLTAGLLAHIFLVAKGVNLGPQSMKVLEDKGLLTYVQRARLLLLKGAPVETPVDFKVESNGYVENKYVGDIHGVAKDLGENTLNIYRDILRDAEIIVMRGPAGVVEDERFRLGTLGLLKSVYGANAFTIIAGGQLASLINENELNARIHVSTGGNALLLYLSGEELPALKAMQLSARMFLGW